MDVNVIFYFILKKYDNCLGHLKENYKLHMDSMHSVDVHSNCFCKKYESELQNLRLKPAEHYMIL